MVRDDFGERETPLYFHPAPRMDRTSRSTEEAILSLHTGWMFDARRIELTHLWVVDGHFNSSNGGEIELIVNAAIVAIVPVLKHLTIETS